MTPLRIAIAGCTGRMGRTLIRLAAADPELRIVAALTLAEDPALGSDAGTQAGVGRLGVPVTAATEEPCDVLLDFTCPAGTRQWAQWCADRAVALVSGTTGLSEADHELLGQVATRVPVLWASNMSLGVSLLLRLVEHVAQAVENWDVEICEAHHRQKVDCPSGTATMLAAVIAEARGLSAQAAVVHGRCGHVGQRPPGQIGMHSLRLGDVVGEHEVHFATTGESLTLRHRATSRDVFAAGALRAAKWIAGREPRLYTLTDVLYLPPLEPATASPAP